MGPLERAKTTATLAANVEARLSEELSQSAGEVLPVPDGKAKAALQKDLRAIKGRLALVESTASAWGDGSQGAPRRDLVQNRIGANPPEVLATLRSDSALSVLAACGVPVTLLERADGTSLREAWRQFLHSSVVPVSDIVAAELSDKLAVDIKLNFDRMFASDLSGRARAFQSLVGGGMDVAKAAALAGLMEPRVNTLPGKDLRRHCVIPATMAEVIRTRPILPSSIRTSPGKAHTSRPLASSQRGHRTPVDSLSTASRTH